MTDNVYCIKSHIPATWVGDQWKEAFPSGNGIVGISVYGAVKNETILVNHGNLWHWGIRDNIPDVSSALDETRKYLKESKYREANSLISDALHNNGYKSELYSPCPVGSIRIQMEEEGSIRKYERVLNMENGEVKVSWQFEGRQYSRRTFVSRIRDIIAFSAEADGKIQGISINMQLHDTGHDDASKMRDETRCHNFYEDGCLIYLAENEENGRFGIAARALDDVKLCDGSDSIKVKDTKRCTVLFKVFGDMDKCITYEDAIKELKKIDLTYDELLSEHESCHKELFHSVSLSLGDEDEHQMSNEEMLAELNQDGISAKFCEKLWHYGRYLFISGTAVDANPFSMYGLWGGRYKLLWSHNMANINLQMMYWHCVTGGYTEYIKSVIDYYYDFMPDLRENAKKVFGLDGIFLPAGTTPGYGLMNQVVPVIVNWIGGAGWVSQHMYEYYIATKDENYLKEKIVPFMEEAALFYEQYLVWDGSNAHIMPSVSPENTPGNLQNEHLRHMAHANPTAKDATMDVAIIKELISNLIKLAKLGKCSEDKLPVWEKILKGLPEYKINSDGAVKEWQDDELEDFYLHRHLSHIYPLFPGKEVMKSDDDLKKAFRRAVELRVLGGQTGWSLASQACIYARLNEGNRALNSLELLAMGCLTASFFSLHNDWRNMGFTLTLDEFESDDKAPVQMDANMGVVNAVQEMILQYSDGIIKLLPAIPDTWDKGKVQRFGFIGGTADMEWDVKNEKFLCRVLSDTDQKLQIYIPTLWNCSDGKVIKATLNNNEIYSNEKEYICVNMKKGESLLLEYV